MADAGSTSAVLAERVELAVGGLLYGNWTEVSVTRAIDTLSGSFELAITARGTATQAPFPVAAGARCALRIGGEPVLEGWVDAVTMSIEGDARTIAVSGRDRTGDLADCSAIHKPGSWRDVKLETIAAELAKPFGIAVRRRADTGAAIRRFALQQGETVHAALERLLRFRGLLMIADANGDVALVTPDEGAPRAVIEQGVNLISAAYRQDDSERFSQYRVKAQAAGDDHRSGKEAAQVGSGVVADPGVTRYRPLLVIAEEQADAGSARKRAQWEAGVRAGRSRAIDMVTVGWRSAPGAPLWHPNLPVRVRAPALLPADAAMLVTEVTLAHDAGGTRATIKAMPPAAYRPLAEPEKRT